MNIRLRYLARPIVLWFASLISKVLLDIKVDGADNLRDNSQPLILIANHFSWFDAPILSLSLPFTPAFVVATESQRHWWFRAYVKVFNGIPIWRGQVDRDAFQKSMTALDEGYVVGIFPEGGMEPELAELSAQGRQLRGCIPGRRRPVLAKPKTGPAWLATKARSAILPVGLLGTERVYRNMIRFRRTPVTVRIGQPFGPLQIDPSLRGKARRQRLDELADLMMQQIAALFPPEARGPYSNIELKML